MIFGLYHDAQEGAGLIAEVLKEQGLSFRPVRLYDGEGLPRDTSDLEGLVVCGRGETMDSFVPRIALRRVDLPTFGQPTRLT